MPEDLAYCENAFHFILSTIVGTIDASGLTRWGDVADSAQGPLAGMEQILKNSFVFGKQIIGEEQWKQPEEPLVDTGPKPHEENIRFHVMKQKSLHVAFSILVTLTYVHSDSTEKLEEVGWWGVKILLRDTHLVKKFGKANNQPHLHSGNIFNVKAFNILLEELNDYCEYFAKNT